MSKVRGAAVKLFGWTITSESSSSSSPSLGSHMMNDQSATDNSEQDNTSLQIFSDLNKESKETSEDSDDQHSEITTVTSEEEKPTDLKKPDKILPCPRCNSGDTKFCYYNNYNVNQPRYFCRNCQRYWTAGGSMRTVPVGSGRRKNKGWVSESLVTDNCKHQSSDTKTQKFNNFQALLPPQVTSSVSPLWPYQYPPNPNFYHMPVYWGCAVPLWSTLETSTCLGKRIRDEASNETVGESKCAFVRTNNETSIAMKNHVWYPVPMKREKT